MSCFVGFYFYYVQFGFHELKEYNLLAFTLIFISVLGVISFFLGIFGCCGACFKNRCLLGFYFFFVLIIFAIQIIIGIAGFYHQEKVNYSYV